MTERAGMKEEPGMTETRTKNAQKRGEKRKCRERW
jgi:hypothetical protein